ncbi:kinesin motor domain-containing protein [Chytriomyces sp. MP71]|nr:kinesin motor domain-containing protein [Chytriomyces sp. MP71]
MTHRGGANNNNITVAVRVRPLLPHERGDADVSDGAASSSANALRSIVDVVDEHMLVFGEWPSALTRSAHPCVSPGKNKSTNEYKHNSKRNKETRYAFDRVFNHNASQTEVFEGTTRPLVQLVCDGFNATVFAYGATGCGKTHTISGTKDDPGIIYKTMAALFSHIATLSVSESSSFKLSVSYLEVYNETIRDLLVATPAHSATKHPLDLREDDENCRVVVSGLSEHCPTTVAEVLDLMDLGNANRIKAPTDANAVSSRSHAVLQVCVQRRDIIKSQENGDNAPQLPVLESVKMATLSIIDLAGSERASATKNKGERLLEGANINRSLLALGNCINALCSDKPNHIPYRDSKLTRLLKYSLGGNCRVVMITNISPSSFHYEETSNTLKYANRAKNIQTKSEQNVLCLDVHVAQYPKLIANLRNEIEVLRKQLANPVAAHALPAASSNSDLSSYTAAHARLAALFDKIQAKRVAQIEADALIARNEARTNILRLVHPAAAVEEEKLHAENVRLRHNVGEYAVALDRYGGKVKRVLEGAAEMGLLTAERLEAAVAGMQARVATALAEVREGVLQERLEEADKGWRDAACWGWRLWERKGGSPGLDDFLLVVAGVTRKPLEEKLEVAEESEFWIEHEDSESECDISLSYDSASETESEFGDVSMDERSNIGDILSEMDEEEAMSAAFNNAASGILAPLPLQSSVNSTSTAVAPPLDDFNVDDLISVFPPSPPPPEPMDSTVETPMRSTRRTSSRTESDVGAVEDEPTPLAKPRTGICTFEVSSPAYCVSSRKQTHQAINMHSTPLGIGARTRAAEIASAAEKSDPGSPLTMSFSTRLRSAAQIARQSLLPVMKPRTPSKTGATLEGTPFHAESKLVPPSTRSSLRRPAGAVRIATPVKQAAAVGSATDLDTAMRSNRMLRSKGSASSLRLPTQASAAKSVAASVPSTRGKREFIASKGANEVGMATRASKRRV